MTTRKRALPVGGMLAALGLWFGGMTAATLVVSPPRVVAFGRPDRLLATAAEADAALIGAGRGFVVVQPGSAAAVRALYAGGAWLVWPSLAGGCGADAGWPLSSAPSGRDGT